MLFKPGDKNSYCQHPPRLVVPSHIIAVFSGKSAHHYWRQQWIWLSANELSKSYSLHLLPHITSFKSIYFLCVGMKVLHVVAKFVIGMLQPRMRTAVNTQSLHLAWLKVKVKVKKKKISDDNLWILTYSKSMEIMLPETDAL